MFSYPSRREKVYKFDDGTGEDVTAYVSFGGLLMALTGSYRHIQNVTVGEHIYLLLRR
jgi:DNA-directed RNA polymerase I, II, and III subunit RPABC3